jgi:hypothetical protein
MNDDADLRETIRQLFLHEVAQHAALCDATDLIGDASSASNESMDRAMAAAYAKLAIKSDAVFEAIDIMDLRRAGCGQIEIDIVASMLTQRRLTRPALVGGLFSQPPAYFRRVICEASGREMGALVRPIELVAAEQIYFQVQAAWLGRDQNPSQAEIAAASTSLMTATHQSNSIAPSQTAFAEACQELSVCPLIEDVAKGMDRGCQLTARALIWSTGLTRSCEIDGASIEKYKEIMRLVPKSHGRGHRDYQKTVDQALLEARLLAPQDRGFEEVTLKRHEKELNRIRARSLLSPRELLPSIIQVEPQIETSEIGLPVDESNLFDVEHRLVMSKGLILSDREKQKIPGWNNPKLQFFAVGFKYGRVIGGVPLHRFNDLAAIRAEPNEPEDQFLQRLSDAKFDLLGDLLVEMNRLQDDVKLEEIWTIVRDHDQIAYRQIIDLSCLERETHKNTIPNVAG